MAQVSLFHATIKTAFRARARVILGLRMQSGRVIPGVAVRVRCLDPKGRDRVLQRSVQHLRVRVRVRASVRVRARVGRSLRVRASVRIRIRVRREKPAGDLYEQHPGLIWVCSDKRGGYGYDKRGGVWLRLWAL